MTIEAIVADPESSHSRNPLIESDTQAYEKILAGSMESIDPFYNPEEEEQAKQQSARNAEMRRSLRARASKNEQVVLDSGSNEFIGVAEVSSKPDTGNKSVPWMPPFGYPPYDNLFLRLHQEVLDFTRWISLTPVEYKRRESFVHRLNGVCKSLWPRSRVVPFGSFFTGLSLPSSDVDVSVIHVPVEHDELAEIGCLRKLANRLLEEQQVSFVELRESAKIPILRIKDIEPPFCEIDISLNSEAPQATSKFIIRNAIEKYPQFRPLVLLIKCFLYQRNLADTFTGGVGSYLLSCLVLAFLQQHAVSNQPRTAELTSMGHLLFDFFSFYAREFRGDREGLSVRRGGSRFLPNAAFNRRSLPTGDALCVESPLEPDLDIGNKVFQWRVVKSAFMQARQVLVDEIQTYDPMSGLKSLLAPNLIDSAHAMFERTVDADVIPACPLSSRSLTFRIRSDSLPPTPYSDDEIDIEAEAVHKRRRHSANDVYRAPNRIVFESEESSGSGRKRYRH
jgi:DNA polymerase sigma